MTLAGPSLQRGRPVSANQVPTIATAAASATGVTVNARYGGDGVVRCVKVSLASTVISLTDDGATGHGSLQLLDMPEGYIAFLGACATGTLTATAGGNISVSVGTTATADATLSTTDANWMAATTASASAFVGYSGPSATALDGHTSAIDIYLNLGTSGDPSSGATVTLTGDIYLYYIHLGD